MYSWNDSDNRRSLIGFGVMAVTLTLALALGLGCSPKRKATRAPEADTNITAKDQDNQADSTRSAGVEVKPEAPVRPLTPPEPLTEEAIAALCGKIEAAPTYAARVEARRTLIHRLREHGQWDRALPELVALLDDVEGQEGVIMARRVVFSEAGNLQRLEEHRAAIQAYRLLLDRYGESPFAPEALMNLGDCHLALDQYAEAEAAWRRLIEEHDGSHPAPWGWRKLALAQLLRGRYDDSLSTLALMAQKYADTQFGEYAQVRGGYVLMAANRLSEARASYSRFLKTCSNSKYCRLAERQLAELDEAVALARANGRR